MIAILKKELWLFFGSWTAWLIITAFSILGTLFLFFFDNDSNIFEIGTASLQSYFSLAPWLFMFIIPALTMKSIAEERQTGTLKWLFSQPVKISEIILGKYFAVLIVAFFCILPSLVYLYTISVLGIPEGNFDVGATLGSYFGLLLISAGFAAIGIFASTISHHQILAYLLGVVLSFFIFFGIEQLASFKLLGSADYWLKNLGFYTHYLSISRGLIDLKDISYFGLFISIFLFISILLLSKKK